jgi:chaperone modulatory protein CbpM
MSETRIWSETEIVAEVDGLTVARLRSFVEARCLAPRERDGRLVYGEAEVARARLLAELVEDFELDADGAATVISLVDQIHGLRRELRALALALADEPDEVRARVRARMIERRGA